MAPRTPLARPGRYFAEREVRIDRVAAVAFVLLLAGPLTVYGVGWALTANLSGSVMVDNPARPPDAFCPEDGCEEPERIERDVDTVMWDVMDRFVGPSFVVYPLVLLGVTLLLHAGVWLVGGERGWFPTFAVAAWGLLPSVAVVLASVVAMRYALDPVTVAPGDDPSTALEPLLDQLRGFRAYRPVGSAIGGLWGAYIWRGGLIGQQGLRSGEATLIAALVAVLNAGGAALL